MNQHLLTGDKAIFAIEILRTGHQFNNKTATWLNDLRIGDWEDNNLLYPFLQTPHRIVTKPEQCWFDELAELSCYDTYLAIHPFYNDEQAFYDAPSEYIDSIVKYDIFLLQWGENLDGYGLTLTCHEGNCHFMWVVARDSDTFEVRNNIQCYTVPYAAVRDTYHEMLTLLPESDRIIYIAKSNPSHKFLIGL